MTASHTPAQVSFRLRQFGVARAFELMLETRAITRYACIIKRDYTNYET